MVTSAFARHGGFMPTPIIAFSKDWHEDPTSNHHVLRELAKTRRVLWLNSLATRKPTLSSSRDLMKIKRKLGEFSQARSTSRTTCGSPRRSSCRYRTAGSRAR
jgi:hypothetical protein